MTRHHVEVHLATARVNPAPGEGLPTVRLLPGAKCHGEDPELFYPDKGQSAIHARRICNGHDGDRECPVKAECLAEQMDAERGLGTSGRHGVFAGTTPAERAKLDRLQNGERGPGRPRALGDDQIADMAREYRAGVTFVELGERYGVSNVGVRRILLRAGVEIRGERSGGAA